MWYYATRWYCAVTMSGIIQICLSLQVDMFFVCLVYGKSGVSGLCVVMWVVVSLCVGMVRCVSRLKYIPMAVGRLSEPVSR